MSVALGLAKRLARTIIPKPLLPMARNAARDAGFIARAPFRYPFRELLLEQGLDNRPHYRWGTLNAALTAKTLGIPRISVIEFGVAGGNGLVALEQIAIEAEQLSGVAIDVYGFDTGAGLTKPLDYRDLPQMWSEGDFKMDTAALRQRLKKAQLVLGPVAETVPKFLAQKPAPIGFVVFDLDLYSSTMDAFKLFEDASSLLLPRVMCYFDDIIGYSHGDFSGERLAITDFNAAQPRRKLSKLYGVRYMVHIDQWWVEQMFMLHAFDHPRYNDYDGVHELRELPLHN